MSLKPPFLRDRAIPLPMDGMASHAANRREVSDPAFLPEKLFLKALRLERRRAERSRKSLLLVLIRVKDSDGQHVSEGFSREILKARVLLSTTIRETDICGWYKDRSICGIVFSEFNEASRNVVLEKVSLKIHRTLRMVFRPEEISQIQLSFVFFPENQSGDSQTSPPDVRLYPDLAARDDSVKFSRAVKRLIDISGSLIVLTLLSPLFALIAITIKLNSPGPVLFRQLRVGQYGARFTFLKFRSMSTQCDPHIHKEYIRRYIAGQEDA
ncbi:MAG: sugar transferase, partial [Candidatus Acidiferrales bacterium]